MSLADRLDRPSEAWRPADPKEFPGHPNPLIGTIVEIEEVEGDYGLYPLIHLRDDAGNEWRWSVFGGVAQGRIAKLEPKVGDKLGVKYLGDKPSRNFEGKKYRDWKIVLEPASGTVAEPDWKAMAAAAEDEGEDDF
jgi:hypothetical protein